MDVWASGWVGDERNKTKQAAYKTMLGKQQTHGMKMILCTHKNPALNMMLV